MPVTLEKPLEMLRGPAWKNRMALAPLTNCQSNADGTLGNDELDFLCRRADGGFGLVTTCGAGVSQSGLAFPGQLGAYLDDHIPGLARLAEAIKSRGAVAAVQLHHAGARANPDISGEPKVGPFANERHGVRALETGEIRQIVEDFIAAAVRCDKAGMDGVTLHGAHGYFLCQFLSTSKNLRDDGYGGTYEGRTQIYWEIIDGIRSATRPDFQLGCRISPEKYDYSTGECLRFVQELVDSGKLDYVDMSLWDSFKLPDEESFHPKRLVDVFGGIARSSGTRLGVAGHIFSAADARSCLAAGADFVYLGRGAILHWDMARCCIEDPNFVARKFPVTSAYLAEQAVGPAFVDYLKTGWSNYVAD